MKTKSIFKYDLFQTIRDLKIFYIVYFAIIILGAITTVVSSSSNIQLNGTEFASIVFLLVGGMNSFKSNFHFSLANSVPRKSLFIGTVGSLAGISIFMTLINLIVSFILTRFINVSPLFYSLYNSKFSNLTPKQALQNISYISHDFIWSIFSLITISLVGYFITLLYYRMSKNVKIIVSVGVPAILIFILPIIEEALKTNVISNSILNIFKTILGWGNGCCNPLIAVLSFISISIVLVSICYLMIRRVTIKSQK